ncbi:MAG: DUF1385 domain-containing protein [Clostridia bacterium]|nr:DUF1385 domain-containing protein [Clostridia bacterium]
MSRITSIGGQALLDGIMMRGPLKTTAAFCDKDGNITTEDIEIDFISKKCRLFRLPVIRGLFNFIDSMRLGTKALNLSAEKIDLEEEETAEPGKFEKWLTDKLGDKLMGIIVGVGSVLGVGLAIVLFMLVPSLLFDAVKHFAGDGIEPLRSAFEGVLKLIVFVLYIWGVSFIPDIRKTFQYHGAEHKCIFCYENELDLTVENVRKQSRLHPRCGTSFMVLMILIGIFIGFFIKIQNPIFRTGVKLLTLPLVMGIGYEVLKYCGKHNNVFTRIAAAPGKWLQKLTTKEPDDRMIATAIEAMKAVIPENGEDLL